MKQGLLGQLDCILTGRAVRLQSKTSLVHSVTYHALSLLVLGCVSCTYGHQYETIFLQYGQALPCPRSPNLKDVS